jgi:phage terminase small subunit
MARHYRTDDVLDYSGQATRRLRPPSRLKGRARAIFVATVSGCAIEHFRASDQPFLERFAESSALAEEAAEKLAAEGAVARDKLSPWFAVHQAATKTMNSLALRLRLTPQSRSPRAVKTRPGPQSYYDLMRLEAEGSNDGDGGPHSGRH